MACVIFVLYIEREKEKKKMIIKSVNRVVKVGTFSFYRKLKGWRI